MSEPPESAKWYKNPQGIMSAATIFTLIIGFFWVREKSMWEMSARISSLENRGATAIAAGDVRFGRMEGWFGDLKEQVNFLERKIDRLESWREEWQKSYGEGTRQKSYESP